MHNVNPVIVARRALGLSRQGLASQANLAQTTVEYLESGAYGSIPYDALSILRIGNPDIESAFEQWKTLERINVSNLSKTIPESFPEIPEVMHPHEEWRSVVNDMGLNTYASAIKVHRNVIQNLERHRQGTYPSGLHIAITQACGIMVAERIRLASIQYGNFSKANESTV